MPPVSTVVPPSGPSRYLCEVDRIHIADRLREKATIRAIAAGLGRSPSTVSREINRNRHPVNGQYRPYAKRSTGKPRPSACINHSRPDQTNHVLRRSPETASTSGALHPFLAERIVTRF